jgi:uncharacterized protein (TIGR02246 family)
MQRSDTAPARAAVIEWVRDLYARAVDHKDAAGFAAAFTPDAWLRFANAAPVVGREAIREAIAQFFTAFVSLRHESAGIWYEGDTLITEAVVTYTRHDRREVTVPAVTIFRVAGVDERGAPLADQCRIYVDLTPLFAPA